MAADCVTLPDSLNQLVMHQPKAVYDSLFEAAWNTIHIFRKGQETSWCIKRDDQRVAYLGTIPHPSSPFAVHALKERIPDVEKKLLDELFKKPWVVYAKRPFANTNVMATEETFMK